MTTCLERAVHSHFMNVYRIVCVCVCVLLSLFRFGGEMWESIVFVPDRCLSF